MKLFSKKTAPGLSEELILRVWDLNGRIKQLEERFEAQLDELSKRYRRAEQSEARFERKKAPCDDDQPTSENGDATRGSTAVRAARRRRSRITEETHEPV